MSRFLVAFLGALSLVPAGQAVAQQPGAQRAATGKPDSQLPVALSAHIDEQPDRARLVLELSDPITPRVFTLANPDRVVLEMPEMLWRLQAADKPGRNSLIRSYRYGQFRAGESRLVIDVNAPVVPSAPTILPPQHGAGFRVVIELTPTTQAKFEESAGWPSDLRRRESAAIEVASIPSLRATTGEIESPRKVIVIDAGHGGIDAGTTGVDGLREKDVVLDEAMRLAKALETRGYLVHLTRDADVYIPLRERVKIARSANADLFISLHADANPDARISGASVYTLSERGSSREAAALARKENRSDLVAGVHLSGQDDKVSHILIELAQRGTMSRSAHFADALVRELSRTTDMIARDAHRSAAFVVLKAPDVPAVLVELGYLSNTRDCRELGDERWRTRTAAAIAAAVDRHFAPEQSASAAAFAIAR